MYSESDNQEHGEAWKRAEAYGIDMSLIVANMHLSVAERLRRHNIALRTMLTLQTAAEAQRGKSN